MHVFSTHAVQVAVQCCMALPNLQHATHLSFLLFDFCMMEAAVAKVMAATEAVGPATGFANLRCASSLLPVSGGALSKSFTSRPPEFALLRLGGLVVRAL